MKFCKDCKHFRPAIAFLGVSAPDRCARPTGERDPVHGAWLADTTEIRKIREDETKCGMGATWFETKGEA